jgi:hypothetical protein
VLAGVDSGRVGGLEDWRADWRLRASRRSRLPAMRHSTEQYLFKGLGVNGRPHLMHIAVVPSLRGVASVIGPIAAQEG